MGERREIFFFINCTGSVKMNDSKQKSYKNSPDRTGVKLHVSADSKVDLEISSPVAYGKLLHNRETAFWISRCVLTINRHLNTGECVSALYCTKHGTIKISRPNLCPTSCDLLQAQISSCQCQLSSSNGMTVVCHLSVLQCVTAQ